MPVVSKLLGSSAGQQEEHAKDDDAVKRAVDGIKGAIERRKKLDALETNMFSDRRRDDAVK